MRISPLNSFTYPRLTQTTLSYGPLAFDSVCFTSNKNIDNLSKTFFNPIEIVFSDIDGTIMRDGKIPKSAIEAAKLLQKKNIPLILSTGRSKSETTFVIDKLGLKPEFTILEQGAVILDKDEKKIYENLITKENAENIINVVNEYKKIDPNVETLLYIDGETYSTSPVNVQRHPHIQPKVVESFGELLNSGLLPTKVLLYKNDSQTDEDLKGLENALKNGLSKDLDYCSSCKWLFDVTNKDITKGFAVELIAQKMGVDLKNSAGLGDSDNDVDMMRAINKFGGLTIAMGDGVSKLKNESKFTTLSLDDDGYKKAIDSFSHLLCNNGAV